MPWLLYALRLTVLTVERMAFHRMGEDGSPLGSALVAYGGGALVLLPLAWWDGRLVDLGAVPSGLVYAGSFFLYLWSLQIGPLAVVAPWPAAAALMLWLWHPDGGVPALLGVVLLVAGGLISAGQSPKNGLRAVAIMLVSDALLAWARFMDQGRAAGPPTAYAFTVFSVVAVVFLLAAIAANRVGEARTLLLRNPLWTILAALTNGTAYFTVVALLDYWPAYLLEALSGAAGVLTVMAAVVWLRDGQALRRLSGAALMAAGAGVLLALRG